MCFVENQFKKKVGIDETEGKNYEGINYYPAVYRVAIFFAVSLAFSAFASDSFFRTNPSPLHSGQIPEPRQASHSFIEACN